MLSPMPARMPLALGSKGPVPSCLSDEALKEPGLYFIWKQRSSRLAKVHAYGTNDQQR